MTARAADYRRTLAWNVGETSQKQITLGSIHAPGEHLVLGVGMLRVGYLGALLGSPVDLIVHSGDGGTIWGTPGLPIDCPCALVVEEPVTVFAAPVAPQIGSNPPITLVLSLTPVTVPSDRLYATRSVDAALAQVIPLPQWVRGVAALPPATFQFRDRSGAVLTSALIGAHDRPAIASDVIVTAAGVVTVYY